MSADREWTPERYRLVAAHVRERATTGEYDAARIYSQLILKVQSLLLPAAHERTAKKMRKGIEAALALIVAPDAVLIEQMKAEDLAAADRYEAKAAQLEAQLAPVIPLNTAAMRQAQHIAESVAKAEAKREAAAATCSDKNLESNLRASIGATNNDSPKGAA